MGGLNRMYLNEFEVDMLYEYSEDNIQDIMKRNHMNYDDACVWNYQQNVKNTRRELALRTRCITSMYARLFPKVKTKDFWKISVVCCRQPTHEAPPIVVGGVAQVVIQFDYNQIFSEDEAAVKKTTLEILSLGIRKVIKKFQMDPIPFQTTSEKIVQFGYDNNWIWKSCKNPSHKYLAQIRCIHHVESIELYLEIYDKENQLVFKKCVAVEIPDEWYYAHILGELKWNSNHEVCLISKEETIVCQEKI